MSGGPSLAERLRRETREEHDAIERALDWEVRATTRAGYRAWLERLHGFHIVWEPAVAAALADPDFFEPRRKLDLLRSDLLRLGLSGAAADALPAPDGWGAIATRAEALGSLYVVEGSMLGGKLIARRVAATFGFAPGYHDAYGEATGAMWRSFRAALDGVADGRDQDSAIGSARRTFRLLRLWLADAGERLDAAA